MLKKAVRPMAKIKQFFIPFFLFLFFLLLDGMVNVQFNSFFSFRSAEMVLRTLFIALYLFSFRLSHQQSLVFALLFGLLYDCYFTSILGIHMAALVIVVILVDWIKDRAHLNILTLGFFSIFIYLFYASFVFFLNHWLGFAQMSYWTFLISRFLPSLVLNTIFYFILYSPLQMIMNGLDLPPLEKLDI